MSVNLGMVTVFLALALAPAFAVRFTPGLPLEQRRHWVLAGLFLSWFGYLAYLIVVALRQRQSAPHA